MNARLKVLLPAILIGLTIIVLTIVLMFRLKEENVREAGLAAAESVANQIVTLRTFYTKEVVKRAKLNNLRVNYDFADRTEMDTIPLPATLVHVLGDQIVAEYPGMKVRLYSRFPFPHRTRQETRLDDFEEMAIDKLDNDPDTPVSKLEKVKRVVWSDYRCVMRSQT